VIEKKTFSILVVTEYHARAVEYSRHIQEAGLASSDTDPDNGYLDVLLTPAIQLWDRKLSHSRFLPCFFVLII